MKFTINLEKKFFFGIMAAVLILAGAITAYAYGTADPDYFGHSGAEVDGVVANANYAATAGSAITATTATTAINAGNADTLDGLDSSAFTQRLMWNDATATLFIDGLNLVHVNSANYATNSGSANSYSRGSTCGISISTDGGTSPNLLGDSNFNGASCPAGKVMVGLWRGSPGSLTSCNGASLTNAGFHILCA